MQTFVVASVRRWLHVVHMAAVVVFSDENHQLRGNSLKNASNFHVLPLGGMKDLNVILSEQFAPGKIDWIKLVLPKWHRFVYGPWFEYCAKNTYRQGHSHWDRRRNRNWYCWLDENFATHTHTHSHTHTYTHTQHKLEYPNSVAARIDTGVRCNCVLSVPAREKDRRNAHNKWVPLWCKHNLKRFNSWVCDFGGEFSIVVC